MARQVIISYLLIIFTVCGCGFGSIKKRSQKQIDDIADSSVVETVSDSTEKSDKKSDSLEEKNNNESLVLENTDDESLGSVEIEQSVVHLILSGSAVDGFVNAFEIQNESLSLVEVVIDGDVNSISYAIIGSEKNCDYGEYIYENIPKSSSLIGKSEGEYKVCYKLSQKNLEPAFGFSKSFILDTILSEFAMQGVPSGKDVDLNINVGGNGVFEYQYKQVLSVEECGNEGYNGNWIAVETPITDAVGADGDYKLCIIGRDSARNVQGRATEYSWSKDTEAPIAVLSGLPTNPSKDTNLNVSIGGDGVIDYQYKKILSNEECSDKEIYNDVWIAVKTPITDAVGADGDYKLCVIGRDNAFNVQSRATEYSWNKDTGAPIAVLSGLPTNPSKDINLNVSISGDGVTDYQYKQILNNEECSVDGAYSDVWIAVEAPITDAVGADGDYKLCVIGRDNAFNIQSRATEYSWNKDTEAPIAVLSNFPVDPSIDTNLNVSVSGNGAIEYRYKKVTESSDCTGGGYNGTWIDIAMPITDLIGSEGRYQLCVIVRDNALNEQSEAQATQHIWTKLDQLNIDPIDINLGSFKINKESAILSFNFTNNSLSPMKNCNTLSLLDVTNFSIVQDQCSGKTLQQDESCMFSVKAHPKEVGDFHTELKLICDLDRKMSANLQVRGRVVPMVGYYDTEAGAGVDQQGSALSKLSGIEHMKLSGLGEKWLRQIDLLLLQNSSENSYADELVSKSTLIDTYIRNEGLVLIFDDKAANAGAVLPGAEGVMFTSNSPDSIITTVPQLVQTVENVADNFEIKAFGDTIVWGYWRGIELYDATDMNNISLHSRFSCGDCQTNLLSGNRLYAGGVKLEVFDVSDLKNPSLISSSGTDTQIFGNLQKQGDYLMTAQNSGNTGFGIYDVVNSSPPTLVGSGPAMSGVGAVGVAVKDNYAFVGRFDDHALLSFDITDPTNIILVDELDLTGKIANTAYLHLSHHTLAVYGYGNTNKNVCLVDITDPTNLTVGACKTLVNRLRYGNMVHADGKLHTLTYDTDNNCALAETYGVSDINNFRLEFSLCHDVGDSGNSHGGIFHRNHVLIQHILSGGQKNIVNYKLQFDNAGGAIGNSTLTTDAARPSSMGYVDRTTLPAGSETIFTRKDNQQVVSFHYPLGTGKVIYSTIPLSDLLDLENFKGVYVPVMVTLGIN